MLILAVCAVPPALPGDSKKNKSHNDWYHHVARVRVVGVQASACSALAEACTPTAGL